MNYHGQRFFDVDAVVPRYFVDQSGKGWIPIGCNLCFDRLYGSEGNDRNACEKRFFSWMREFAANGGNFLRLWLGHPFFEVMPDCPGAFDAAAAETLKKAVSLAEELGIRLKFTLEVFRKTIPPEDASYPPFFVRPLYAPFAKDMREFFESRKCFEIYLGKARFLKTLGFGDSPAVFCWELWNEINATDATGAYERWSDNMLAELTSLFPRQLVVQNLGSFDGPGALHPYDQMAKTERNAFMQIHRYLDPGAALDACRGPMDILCADAIREILDRRPDRPAILAETGAVKWCHTGPSELYDSDTEGVLLHDALFAPFFAGSAGCGQPWHWDSYIARHGLWRHFRLFARAVEGLDPVEEAFRPFHTETRTVRVWGLHGRHTMAIWCRDKASTWESELRRRVPPAMFDGVELPFNSRNGFRVYLPWEDLTVDLPPGRCRLPSFRRSCVVRFTDGETSDIGIQRAL